VGISVGLIDGDCVGASVNGQAVMLSRSVSCGMSQGTRIHAYSVLGGGQVTPSCM